MQAVLHCPLREAARLGTELNDAGIAVAALECDLDCVYSAAARVQPETIVVQAEKILPALLEHLAAAAQAWPMIMLTSDATEQAIDRALRTGVAAYIAGDYRPARLGSIVRVAIARFAMLQELRAQTHAAAAALEERKLVERAKGMLMQRNGWREDEAYRFLRSTAMQRKQRLGALARHLLDAERMLSP